MTLTQDKDDFFEPWWLRGSVAPKEGLGFTFSAKGLRFRISDSGSKVEDVGPRV